MIFLLSDKALPSQIETMLEEYGIMIKVAVDIRKQLLVGGGEMHADCERILLENGSEQGDIWGANWYPQERRVEFEALINIRPQDENRGMLIQRQEIRDAVETVIKNILEVER